MREPEWVYVQRRQRAAVAAAMVVGAIAMLIVFGTTALGGFDLDGKDPVALDKPDVDQILAREERKTDAEKQRKAERREQRAEQEKEQERREKAKRKRER